MPPSKVTGLTNANRPPPDSFALFPSIKELVEKTTEEALPDNAPPFPVVALLSSRSVPSKVDVAKCKNRAPPLFFAVDNLIVVLCICRSALPK